MASANGGMIREYKVKDISEAEFGRLEIQIAEGEMPGLMACRSEMGSSQPLKGARISGCLHMTIQTAVLIETLTALGAQVRWCSSNIFSTQDHAAAAVARDSASVFAWKGETLEEYWWCLQRALDWGPHGGPDLVVDDGADITMFLHRALRAEQEYPKTATLPSPPPASTDGLEAAKGADADIVMRLLRQSIQEDPNKYHGIMKGLVGASEETTTGVKRLHDMQSAATLLYPAININDSVTKSKVYWLNDFTRPLNLLLCSSSSSVCHGS